MIFLVSVVGFIGVVPLCYLSGKEWAIFGSILEDNFAINGVVKMAANLDQNNWRSESS